jgi:outer membrane immunogenic protein
MRRLLLGATTSLALGIAPAIAADLPARTFTKAPAMITTIYDWSGFYLGLNAGGGSARTCWTNKVAFGGVAATNAEGCHDAAGALAGGQIGYRWQAGSWVFGVEGQGNWANLKGSNTSQLAPAATNQTKVNGVGLLTGQIGYAWNNVLWYVKGGAAVAGEKYTGLATGTGAAFDQASTTRWGATIGTGVEVGFARNWSVGAEYEHIFMGNKNLNFSGVPAGAATRTDTVGQDVDMATVRVNYRWGGPVVSKH